MAAPDVILTIEAEISTDCTRLTITDTTPVGTSTTGYDQTLGLQVADILTTTLDIVIAFTDGTSKTYTQVDLFPTTSFPLPFVSGAEYSLQMDSFGGTAGDAFPEGVAQITYTVNGTISAEDVYYSTECYQLFSCSTKCCIDQAVADLEDCSCAEDTSGLWDAYMNLNGACEAASCSKPKKALQLLGAAQKYCNNDCKTC